MDTAQIITHTSALAVGLGIPKVIQILVKAWARRRQTGTQLAVVKEQHEMTTELRLWAEIDNLRADVKQMQIENLTYKSRIEELQRDYKDALQQIAFLKAKLQASI